MNTLKLGALDFCRIGPQQKSFDSVWETIELARELDKIGYHRYWLGEHHNPGIAHSSPELLLPVLAGSTGKMRVGTAGVLLRFYSPLKVAKNFRLLHALFANRIDLGIARGNAEEAVCKRLLMGSSSEREYGDKVSDLLQLLRGEIRDVAVNPQGIPPPEIWLLGSGTETVRIAAKNGTAFCLSLFLDIPDKRDPKEILDIYRDEFVASHELSEPRCSIAVAGVCADSERRAASLVSMHNLAGIRTTIVGGPECCRGTALDLCARLDVSEIVFLDLCEHFDSRLRSYRLLSEVLGNCV